MVNRQNHSTFPTHLGLTAGAFCLTEEDSSLDLAGEVFMVTPLLIRRVRAGMAVEKMVRLVAKLPEGGNEVGQPSFKVHQKACVRIVVFSRSVVIRATRGEPLRFARARGMK